MDQIKYEGKSILSKGYGVIPKLVMQSNISIEAKSIYAYMCSFAGGGQSAFPSVEKILIDLKISKNRFYKYRNELEEMNFIKVQKTRKDNRRGKNIYIINQIVFENDKKSKKSLRLQFEDIENEELQIEDIGFEDIENEDINNNKTNNNKTNNNITNNNNNIDVVVNKDFKKVLKGFNEKDTKSILKFCYENKIDVSTLEEKLKVVNGLKKVNNRVGALIKAIKEDWQPSSGQVNNNCNFSQRDYDYDDLEKKLLGWED